MQLWSPTVLGAPLSSMSTVDKLLNLSEQYFSYLSMGEDNGATLLGWV